MKTKQLLITIICIFTVAVAVFPCVNALNLGKDTIGATIDPTTGNRMEAYGAFNTSETIQVSELKIYVNFAEPETNITGFIYSDNAGTPNYLIDTTIENATQGNTGWVSLPFETPVTLNAGNYWLGVLLSDAIEAVYDVGIYNRVMHTRTYLDGCPDTFGTSDYSSASKDYSIYAVYELYQPTPTSTPTATPTTTETGLNATFYFLMILLAFNIVLILFSRDSTPVNILTLVLGIFTFAFGAFSLTVSNLPFTPYFNILVIVIGVITTLLALRGRN